MISHSSNLSTEEFYAMSRALEVHHTVFYSLWQMGKPCFVDDTETAYVRFNKEGNFIKFAINEEFWKKSSFTTKQFIICHEAMHVILNHGIRTLENFSIIANQALDIVVNHLIIKKFGIKREDIDNWKDLCWIDTLFKDHKEVKLDQNFEYYFNLLKKESKKNEQGDGDNGSSGVAGGIASGKTVDDHSKSFSPDATPCFDNVIDKLNEDLNPEEKESLKDMIEKHFQKNDGDGESGIGKGRGTEAGNSWKFMDEDPKKIVKKRKWETVIKKWASKYLISATKEREQWARVNRRFTFMQNSNFFIPSEMEVEEFNDEEKKITVHFFLDTSGSCAGLAPRFWKAANSLPDDKFNVKLFCFDTRVYEVEKEKKKLYGFGGTSFDIIEEYIQHHLKDRENKGKYPEAVFMITDGCGNDVRPQYPDRWHIFLTDDDKSCFPSNVRFFELKDYE